MPFKEIKTRALAKDLGINFEEVKEKQRLIGKIIEVRKAKKMSQVSLAKKMNLTQSRIAQIESGVGTAKITFDVLFNVLHSLGYSVKLQVKKSA